MYVTPKGLLQPSVSAVLVGNCWPNQAESVCELSVLPLDTAECQQRTRPKHSQPSTMMSATGMIFPSTQYADNRQSSIHNTVKLFHMITKPYLDVFVADNVYKFFTSSSSSSRTYRLT